MTDEWWPRAEGDERGKLQKRAQDILWLIKYIVYYDSIVLVVIEIYIYNMHT